MIEEVISTERAHHTGKIQRNDGTKKRAIVVKILNFKNKSRILRTYKEKKLWKEGIFVNKDFFGGEVSICNGLLQKAKDLRSQNKVAK